MRGSRFHWFTGLSPMPHVIRFGSLGFSFPDLTVHVNDLPDEIGIDCWLGLSFLFNYEARSQEDQIGVERTRAS